MSIFKRKRPEPPAEVAEFDRWSIISTFKDGRTINVNGSAFGADPVEMLRYVDALAAGLRDAGFDAAVSIERKQVTVR